MKIPTEVPSSLRELAAVLSQPKPMRRGSVSERTMKCGKAGCPCQGDPKARHGPYYSLTRPMAGKTHSRYLSPEQAECRAPSLPPSFARLTPQQVNFPVPFPSLEQPC